MMVTESKIDVNLHHLEPTTLFAHLAGMFTQIDVL